MIEKININSVNTNNKPIKKQPQFKGAADLILGGIQMCESNPMVNVAVLDLSTAIIPRTVVEGQTNIFAGMEAFRREASGLIINCMIPGLIVAGIAKGIQGLIMGNKTQMGSCLANEDTINLVKKYWTEINKNPEYKTPEQRVHKTFENILHDTKGIDGEKTVDFADYMPHFETTIKKYTKSVIDGNVSAKELKEAYQEIAKQTFATENIMIGKDAKGYFSQNLKAVLDNTAGILKDLTKGKNINVESFARKAIKLLNTKSLLGMAVILPIAVSAQPINRWITAKTSGKKGAPIYKDFSQTKCKELSKKDKAALFRQKLISVGSMIGVAILSMGFKLPNMKVLQFSGLFPTMDQARIISTATFASRMMASEDKNDLREATFRDIATFSSFYFLGDYVAKGVASLIQKHNPKYTLINVKKPLKPNANIIDKIIHWTKDTALKSSDEVHAIAKDSSPKAAEAAIKSAKNMRAACQLANIAFSLISLGIVIPKLYRHKTEKEHKKELDNVKA